MPLKTYETIGVLNRYITAIIDEKEVSISFINGIESPRKIQGRFTTKNKDIQNWIENSSDFNRKYRLVSASPLPGERAPKKAVVDHPDDDKARATNNTPVPDNGDDLAMSIPEETDEDILIDTLDGHGIDNELSPIIVDDVINGQQARNYLIANYKDELTFRQLGNNQQIIAEAKARGIQFINWEAFVEAK